MGCYYSVDTIYVPQSTRVKVEALLKKYDLDYVFDLINQSVTPSGKPNNEYPLALEQKDGHMAYSSASAIADEFLPALAKLLKGTGLDGQVIYTSIDDSPGTLVLSNGESQEFSGHLEVIHIKPSKYTVRIGEERTIAVEAKVIGLGNNKVVITEVKE
jgi:hypothetical protein